MKKVCVLLLPLLYACSEKEPNKVCTNATQFEFTVKDYSAKVGFDSTLLKPYLQFSINGELYPNFKAYPCNLGSEYGTGALVYFSGDIYKNADSLKSYSVYIKKISYQ